MLDINKYIKRAKINPAFRKKLLKNANQTIREEFGEELPYKVICQAKLVFRVKPRGNLSGNDLRRVSGGSGTKENISIPSGNGFSFGQDYVHSPVPPENLARAVYGANPNVRPCPMVRKTGVRSLPKKDCK